MLRRGVRRPKRGSSNWRFDVQLEFTTESPSVHLCECGTCGLPTKIAPFNSKRLGWTRGTPLRFVNGHNHRSSPADRFWEKVNKNGPIPAHRPELGPCWLWMAGMIAGYGCFQSGLAHRFGYALQVGPIPDTLNVCHHCDVRLCVRGSHLFVGTTAENNRDMREKGRHQTGDTHWTRRLNFRRDERGRILPRL